MPLLLTYKPSRPTPHLTPPSLLPYPSFIAKKCGATRTQDLCRDHYSILADCFGRGGRGAVVHTHSSFPGSTRLAASSLTAYVPVCLIYSLSRTNWCVYTIADERQLRPALLIRGRTSGCWCRPLQQPRHRTSCGQGCTPQERDRRCWRRRRG